MSWFLKRIAIESKLHFTLQKTFRSVINLVKQNKTYFWTANSFCTSVFGIKMKVKIIIFMKIIWLVLCFLSKWFRTSTDSIGLPIPRSRFNFDSTDSVRDSSRNGRDPTLPDQGREQRVRNHRGGSGLDPKRQTCRKYRNLVTIHLFYNG